MGHPKMTPFGQDPTSTVCEYTRTPVQITSVHTGVGQDRVFRGPHLGVLISPTSCCTISITSSSSPQHHHPKSEHPILEVPKWAPQIAGSVQDPSSTVCVYTRTPVQITSVHTGVGQDRVFRGAHLEVVFHQHRVAPSPSPPQHHHQHLHPQNGHPQNDPFWPGPVKYGMCIYPYARPNH